MQRWLDIKRSFDTDVQGWECLKTEKI